MSYDRGRRPRGRAGFAKLMAARGANVLVLERPTEFRHRVRGDVGSILLARPRRRHEPTMQ